MQDVSDEKNKKYVLVDIKETGKSSVAYFKRYRQKIEGLRFGTCLRQAPVSNATKAAILFLPKKQS